MVQRGGRMSSRPSEHTFSRYRGRSSSSSYPRSSRGRSSSYRGSGRHYDKESELMSKLSRMGERDSEVALEIVNAVLAAKSGGDDYGPPSKIRRTERGRGSSSSYRGGRGGHRGSYRPYREGESEGRKRARSEEKTEENIVQGAHSEGEVAVPDKPAFELPTEALHCKICNINTFKSKRAYLEHRDSSGHTELNNLFQRRNSSIIRLIRGHAKVQTSRRDYLEACRICHGRYDGSYQNHKATLDHEIVENFLKWTCCGKFFNSRQDYDDHTLTPFHLVNKYEELKQWEKTESEQDLSYAGSDNTSIEALQEKSVMLDIAIDNFNKIKTDLMEEIGEDPDDKTSFPDYDPDKPFGMKFITGEKVFRCKACVVEIVGNKIDDIKSHLHSPDHYFEVLRQTNLQKKKVTKEKADESKSKIPEEEKEVKQDEEETELKEEEQVGEEEQGDEEEAEYQEVEGEEGEYEGQEDEEEVEGEENVAEEEQE